MDTRRASRLWNSVPAEPRRNSESKPWPVLPRKPRLQSRYRRQGYAGGLIPASWIRCGPPLQRRSRPNQDVLSQQANRESIAPNLRLMDTAKLSTLATGISGMRRDRVLIIVAALIGLAWFTYPPARANVPHEAETMLSAARAVQSPPCDNCPDGRIAFGAGCLAGCGAAIAVSPMTACPAIVPSGEQPPYASVAFADRAVAPADRPPKSTA